MRGMTYRQKWDAAKADGIEIPERVLNEDIVGIYGFFAKKGDEKTCFYIGKATNMRCRLFDGNNEGHIHYYFTKPWEKTSEPDNVRKKKKDYSVPINIHKYVNDGYKVFFQILEEVDYTDSSFSRAAHRLAFAELKAIVEYQKNEQCLEQLPEGVGSSERKYWEDHYKN